jgi:Ceramidase
MANAFLMKPFYKNLLMGLVVAAAVGVMFFLDPIPQDLAYHDFSDKRALFGVPNFWNVASNLPFLLVGAIGLLTAGRLASQDLRLHYLFFCTAVMLVAFGSAYYHLDPSTPTLVWDRLPMTAAFMSLLSAVIADRISWVIGRALLWPLVVIGIASIAWWVRTEAVGQGDLRAYALVQFLPMLLLPMMLLLWRGEGLRARPLWIAFGAYAAAKLAEQFDYGIMAATGGFSGHSLKHLIAALAAWWIVRAFQRSPASAL